MKKLRVDKVEFNTFTMATLGPDDMVGKMFFKVTKKKDFAHFHEALIDGVAHIDRGFNYLGKATYQRGLGSLLVHWHVPSKDNENGIQTPFSERGGLYFCPPYLFGQSTSDGDNSAKENERVLQSPDFQAYMSRIPNSSRITNEEMDWVAVESLVWVLEPNMEIMGEDTELYTAIKSKNIYYTGETSSADKQKQVRFTADRNNDITSNSNQKVDIDDVQVKSSVSNPLISNSSGGSGSGGSEQERGRWVSTASLEEHKRWDEVVLSYSEEQQFQRQVQVARYYESQILLMAELCLDRNMRTISSLETTFPFPVVFNGMQNPLLPNCIRTAFVRLMSTLWIDRHPHSIVQTPAAVRFFYNMKHDVVLGMADKAKRKALPQFYLEEDDPLREDENDFYNMADMRKMRLLKVSESSEVHDAR
jgi:hypothetical protein